MFRHPSFARSAVLLLALCLPLAGCNETGPQKTLTQSAKALQEKDVTLFLGQIDMNAFTYHELVNLRQDNSLLNLAGNLGALFGVNDQLEELLLSATNLKGQYINTFTRTVGSGELMAQCARASTADCPWDPDGLRKAELKQLNEKAAIARVTTKANISSWIALRKNGENWYIVGKSASEERAALFANDENQPPVQKKLPMPKMPGHASPQGDTQKNATPEAGRI